ncbi:MAG: hypothetical protein JJ895_14625 [Balneolaceae bacterium]|nr:hypothetical protein [Balneolaceae bacterium]
MSDKNSINDEIYELQNQVVNTGLILFSGVGIVIQIVSYFRDVQFDVGQAFIIQSVSLLGIIGITILRQKLSLNTKIVVLFAVVLLTLITGLSNLGYLANATVYITVLPFILSFIRSYRQAFSSLLLLTGIFITFGFLYTSGTLTYSIDVEGVVTSLKAWVLYATILFFTSWVTLYIGHRFKEKLKENYSELKQYKDNLEQMVGKKTADLEKTLSELKNTQDQLVYNEKLASLGILTSGVAHELNNPLNFIQGGLTGISEFFEDNPQLKDEELEFYLHSIETGFDRSKTIVSGLSQFSEQSDDMHDVCDLHLIIKNCVVILNQKLDDKITVNKMFSLSPAFVKGNNGKLHQVFLNILTNSIQAIPESGTIDIETNVDDQVIAVNIKDSGIGISKDILPKISEPFFTTRSPGEGTGLGLSIVFKILSEHNAIITYNSNESSGTEVNIEFEAFSVT